ncbi:hypothetical protein BH20ACT14_BH20ACT14_19950 [soil metagenome]
MIPEERLRRYAELTVRVGTNVQEGQDVIVTGYVEHAEIARAVARESYRAGAKHVIVLYGDLHLRRAAIELGPEEEIGWSAPHLLDLYRRAYDERPAFVSLTGNPNPDLLGDLDAALVGRSEPKELRAASLELITARRINWTVIAAPNVGWATQVFGEPDVERLWVAVATANCLDHDDPVAAWNEHVSRLQERADGLNERSFDAIRFSGPGTNLTVGLVPDVRWTCARMQTEAGIEHIRTCPRRRRSRARTGVAPRESSGRRLRFSPPAAASTISRCVSRAGRSST